VPHGIGALDRLAAVGDHQHGGAPADRGDHAVERRARGGVEIRVGLVEQQ
jgi:hypothetical protein